MKIIVTGATGQLGSDICSELSAAGDEVRGLSHSDLELNDFDAVRKYLVSIQPDVIVNTAAYHNVELCETNPEEAGHLNAELPALLATLSNEIKFKLIHISTDYVFDGAKNAPYSEKDKANPLNNYGRTKLQGEEAIASIGSDYIIMRVSAIYGINPCRAKNGLNFIRLMLKLANEKGEVTVVNDEFVSPTATQNIAEQIRACLQHDIKGLVHATSEGSCTWYEFAKEIFEYSKTPVTLHKAIPSTTPPKVMRPKYSVLENSVLKESGINRMKHWKDSLHTYLDMILAAEAN